MSQIEGSIQIRSTSASTTRQIAAEVAGLCRAGDLIVLIGGLGAGKTVFAQGLSKGLGVTGRVTSPTFALVQTYEGVLRVNHLDVYRLTHISETADLALPELLDDDAVTLVEWGDMIISALPREYLEVTLVAVEEAESDKSAGGAADPGLADSGEDDPRELQLVARGSIWRPRMGALRARLAEMDTGGIGPIDRSDGRDPESSGSVESDKRGEASC